MIILALQFSKEPWVRVSIRVSVEIIPMLSEGCGMCDRSEIFQGKEEGALQRWANLGTSYYAFRFEAVEYEQLLP